MSVEQAYNSWAEQYDTNINKTRDLEAGSLREMLAGIDFGDCLEVGCGTGQLTIPVAGLGLPVVGLDLSSAMLNVARSRASAVNAPVTFVQGDMRDFRLERDFKLIFVARNSLLHLLSTADLLAALTAVRRHLAPDGVFAFGSHSAGIPVAKRMQPP